MSHYAITGIQEGLDGKDTDILRKVPLRMELDEWCSSTDVVHKNQRALFFQAFNDFCRTDPTEKLSYFQIAGIHGQPFVPWDEDHTAKVENSKSGYCTHNSILFTTWHRPYMLLFEQVLYEMMDKVVDTFPEDERATLREALKSWRFPYWDWAAKKPDPNDHSKPANYNVPVVLPYKGVEIKVPPTHESRPSQRARSGQTLPPWSLVSVDTRISVSQITESFANDPAPLFQLNVCKATTRYAELGSDKNFDQRWIDGQQENKAVVDALRSLDYEVDGNQVPGSLRASPSDAFYRVVTIPKFEDFATKRLPGRTADDKPSSKEDVYASAENLHDWVHGVCGGAPVNGKTVDGKVLSIRGHMSWVPAAAFDPIFWIHHCNVDRMVAIWEVLHSGNADNWFDGSDIRDKDSGNWAIKKNQPDKPSDPLRPFHKKDGDYWTSNDVRETAPLGYTYPELEKWKYVDGQGHYDVAAHKAALNKYLHKVHNVSANAAFLARQTADPGEEGKPSLSDLQLTMTNLMPKEDIIGFDDYVVDIIYNRFALGGLPYTINIFVGKVPDQLPYAFNDPEGSLVGQVYTFSSPADQLGTDAEAGCINCRSQEAAQVLSSGTVVLTNALITRWKNQLKHTPRQKMSGSAPDVLASMRPEDVIPFLQANLRWRVTSVNGVVPREELNELRVSVAMGKADHYADRTKPSRYYDYQGAYEVTRGRPQGASPDDHLY
ncbi:hypothetical protein QBC42DRAFT_238563 [Cladorrhinum samala]|uniref:tyrosinase n=1 Tax=Cladorrhinum samala TaxID=585594 RepID=A0AAV9H7L1_9PEZI|nr:hypothetical protein QBC42DRAFT_238563 [Cladorrhinum samala]